jgi:membrane-bound acyltransferase YfiQ involved in biofilm formation
MKFPDSRLVVGSWLVVATLIISMLAFNFLNNNASLKRRVFRWYIVIAGVMIGWWFYLLGGPESLLVLIPVFAVSAYISLKTTRFCDACGKTLMNQFTRAKFCPRCGADLDAQDANRAIDDRS